MSQQNISSKKHQIKCIARELFTRWGYKKTTLEDIAHRCQFAKPTLYYYYPNKEAIFNEVVLEEAQSFIDHVIIKIPSDLPADERIAQFAHTTYTDMKALTMEMMDAPASLDEFSLHGQPLIYKIRELFRNHLRSFLQTGQRDGSLNYDDEEITLQTLACMADFVRIDWMRRTSDDVRDRIIDTMLQIVLFGLKR